MPTLDLWFDYACPAAWPATRRALALADAAGIAVRLRPVPLTAIRTPGADVPPVKAAWLRRDEARVAALAGLPHHPPASRPDDTVRALSATLAAGSPPDLVDAWFEATWGGGSPPEGAAPEAASPDASTETALAATVAEARALGVFGVPTWILWEGTPGESPYQLWWGHDRATLVAAALGLPASPPPPRPAVPGTVLEVWFDYSSPFAWLGVRRAPGIAARTGVTLVYRPMLLGALFSAVGQPNVPLHTFSEAKRTWYVRDLREQALDTGAELQFNTRFPLRTVLPLRLTLAHPDPATFLHRVFAATWEHDQDPTDLAVLRRCGAADALPPGVPDTDEALLAVANEQKNVLFANTTEAAALGMFGAPSWRVLRPGHEPWITWGQDRADQVEAVITGWEPPE